MPDSSSNESRRNVLKLLGATGAGFAGGSSVLSTVAVDDARGASDSPKEEWTKNTKVEDKDNMNIGVYLATDVGWHGATWISSRSAWEHNFREDTTISSRDTSDGSDLCAIQKHEMWVNQGTTPAIGDYSGDKYTGVYPNQTYDDYDHTDLAIDLAETAIQSLSTWVEFAYTVEDIVGKMHADEGAVYADYPVHHVWDYYSDDAYVYCDVSHYKWWTADVGSGDTARFDIKSKVYGTNNHDCSVIFNFKISGDNVPTEGNVDTLSTSTDGSTSSTGSNDGWEIEKIPEAKIRERAEELPIPDSTVKELERAGEPAYFAHKAPVELVDVTVETT